MSSQYNFRIYIGNDVQTVAEKDLGEYATLIGLDRVATDRYSWLFAMQLLLHPQMGGVDSSMVIAELKALEGGIQTVGTKPATEFTKKPLKGLWHKHFFSAHFLPQNLRNHLAGDKLKALVEKVLDPKKNPVVTDKIINKLSHELVAGTFEKRRATDKLTGEWIIFAKYNSQNYYLCLSTHNTGDQVIYNQIKSACFLQFPFLQLTP